jgi:hypothetical protein
MRTYLKHNINIEPFDSTTIQTNRTNRSWFYANELTRIYKI